MTLSLKFSNSETGADQTTVCRRVWACFPEIQLNVHSEIVEILCESGEEEVMKELLISDGGFSDQDFVEQLSPSPLYG